MSDPEVTLEPLGDGAYLARWHPRRFRFMFDDGSTVDVESHRDDSTLRGALLEAVGVDRKREMSIEGVADLTKPEPATPARKRRAAK